MTLEREIYSIETANINKETLEAMKNASKAMKDIHGGLTIEKVDQTMYVKMRLLSVQILTTATPQGRTSRSTRYCRGNWRGNYTNSCWTRCWRSRVGWGTRNFATRRVGQQNAGDWPCSCGRQGRRYACCTTRRWVWTFRFKIISLLTFYSQRQSTRCWRRRRGGRTSETPGRDGFVRVSLQWALRCYVS